MPEINFAGYLEHVAFEIHVFGWISIIATSSISIPIKRGILGIPVQTQMLPGIIYRDIEDEFCWIS